MKANQFAKTMLLALFLTMLLSAGFHMILVIANTIKMDTFYYINPINLLGISLFFPKLQNSTAWLIISSVLLAIVYFVVLTVAYKKQIAITTKNKTKE